MSTGSSPSGGFRDSLKRRARGVKKWFRTGDQALTSHTSSRVPSPQPQPSSGASPSQLAPTHGSLLLSAQSPHSVLLPHPVPSGSRSTSTANLVIVDSAQSADAESRLTQAAKKAGAEAWIGLKATLNLLERSSDAFPPLKSAVAGFLGVVDIFEASDLSMYASQGAHPGMSADSRPKQE